jgi:hypothetical protein
VANNLGRWSSVALAASGAAIAAQPDVAAKPLGLAITSARGRAETRAGLGGTFAALGTWALVRNSPDVYRAVGLTWLGAAALRLASLRIDEPETDLTYWAFLAAELGFGLAGLAARR